MYEIKAWDFNGEIIWKDYSSFSEYRWTFEEELSDLMKDIGDNREKIDVISIYKDGYLRDEYHPEWTGDYIVELVPVAREL